MSANGCSFGLDKLARVVNTIRGIKSYRRSQHGAFFPYIKAAWRQAHVLAFSFCCSQHDLLYDQGTPWKGWKHIGPWFVGRIKDVPARWLADRLLRQNVAANLKQRNRPLFVQIHVPWFIWIGIRLGGWISWGRQSTMW